MMREIGSNFWINLGECHSGSDVNLNDYGLYDLSDWVFTSTARSAESIIVGRIVSEDPDISRVALVPPFTCHTVLDPLLERHFMLCSYPIDRDLNTTPEMLEQAMRESRAKVVLLHRYFGFDTLRGCADIVERYSREGGVIFIEDHTQSMYSGHEALPAQYHFGSLRKWLGVPDGGFAALRYGYFEQRPTEEHREMVELKLRAGRLKYDYMEGRLDNKEEFRSLYREAERLLDSQEIPYRMARESRELQAGADLAELKKARRENYKQVYEMVCGGKRVSPLMPALGDRDVPLYLTVIADQREKLQKKLSDNNIYAPVLWPRAGSLPKICGDAEYLYRHALCLPIDQRYAADDMRRMAECVQDFERYRDKELQFFY